jgi:hypothetical protein
VGGTCTNKEKKRRPNVPNIFTECITSTEPGTLKNIQLRKTIEGYQIHPRKKGFHWSGNAKKKGMCAAPRQSSSIVVDGLVLLRNTRILS